MVAYAHPFELILGAILIVTALLPGIPGGPEDGLPRIASTGYHAVSLLGGLGVLLGLRYRALAIGRAVERACCYLIAGVWSAYGVLVWHAYGDAGARTGLAAILVGVGCLLRARAIILAERVILEQLRHANRDQEALRRIIDGRPPDGGGA